MPHVKGVPKGKQLYVTTLGLVTDSETGGKYWKCKVKVCGHIVYRRNETSRPNGPKWTHHCESCIAESAKMSSKFAKPALGHTFGTGNHDLRCQCGKTWYQQQSHPTTCPKGNKRYATP